jgi:hypothetical protein
MACGLAELACTPYRCVINKYAIEGTSRDGKKEMEEKRGATEKVRYELPSFSSRNDIIHDRCWYDFVALWSKL